MWRAPKPPSGELPTRRTASHNIRTRRAQPNRRLTRPRMPFLGRVAGSRGRCLQKLGDLRLIIGRDEPKALLVAEPLHGPSRDRVPPGLICTALRGGCLSDNSYERGRLVGAARPDPRTAAIRTATLGVRARKSYPAPIRSTPGADVQLPKPDATRPRPVSRSSAGDPPELSPATL